MILPKDNIYAAINGGNIESTGNKTEYAVLNGNSKKWPNKIIPYIIHPSASML